MIVGAGLLGGSMILSLEQLVIDAEIFRMSKQAHRGIPTHDETWLDDVIQQVGPGGNYLGEKSTGQEYALRGMANPRLGVHDTQKILGKSGRKDVLDEAREIVDQILRTHKPLPLGNDIEKELICILQESKRELITWRS